MKYQKIITSVIVTLISILAVSGISAQNKMAEDPKGGIIEDKRPFDFTDKYYWENGVNPSFIVNRRSGEDKSSVVDYINSPNHRQVRLIATSAAYSSEGKPLYLAVLGELPRYGFTQDQSGVLALEKAEVYPIYIFPSDTVKEGNRQAVVIGTTPAQDEKNPLGLRVIVQIEFTNRINTDKGREAMDELIKRNGVSTDGTPIIQTVDEIQYLTRNDLVTQRVRGLNDKSETSFLATKVLWNPKKGAIAPDAYLMLDLHRQREPVKAEQSLMEHFDCLQKTGGWCAE